MIIRRRVDRYRTRPTAKSRQYRIRSPEIKTRESQMLPAHPRYPDARMNMPREKIRIPPGSVFNIVYE